MTYVVALRGPEVSVEIQRASGEEFVRARDRLALAVAERTGYSVRKSVCGLVVAIPAGQDRIEARGRVEDAVRSV